MRQVEKSKKPKKWPCSENSIRDYRRHLLQSLHFMYCQFDLMALVIRGWRSLKVYLMSSEVRSLVVKYSCQSSRVRSCYVLVPLFPPHQALLLASAVTISQKSDFQDEDDILMTLRLETNLDLRYFNLWLNLPPSLPSETKPILTCKKRKKKYLIHDVNKTDANANPLALTF